MTTVIAATKPAVSQAVAAVTYDKWFVTQIVGKFTPTSGLTTISLQRAAQNTDGSWTLMPNNTPGASVTFNVDIIKEITSGDSDAALMQTAYDAVVAAVSAYATAQKLI